MKVLLKTTLLGLSALLLSNLESNGQITKVNDYLNTKSAPIGTFQGINFREAGFSGLFAVPNTNGREFWTVSDRGANVDAANANPSACRPTYDKIYGFPNYAPKIHRIRVNGDSIQILQTITMKRPNGANATGLLNPAGYGSTALEVISTDTVLNCANFNAKTIAKDVWGIDSEGIAVDKDGSFWICEEGGPTIWKLNKNGVVMKRFTPYGNLPGIQPEDILIDTVFKYRKNNRGFEGISIAPNGKVYAIIQSPVLFPNKAIGEETSVHRILEINTANNATRMFAYLNSGVIGASGANQIRLRDWKIGDMAAVNDSTFLVIEAALRGTSDYKRIYSININQATPITSALYNGKTVEEYVDSTGLASQNIKAVRKTLFMDLVANGFPSTLEKPESLAIINDSTIAVGNDNDYGQVSPSENGIATATSVVSHVIIYSLRGNNKIRNYKPFSTLLSMGNTGLNSSQTPYLTPVDPMARFTSLLTAGDAVGSYKMVGIPDGLGAYDNGNGTFTVLMNHEIPAGSGGVRAHGANGAFVSKWIINKSDLVVQSGSDLIRNVNLWNGTAYAPSASYSFGRFCSADLPEVSAFYNSTTNMGTNERIFLNGEETGNEGKAFGHIATGPNAGTTYELPALGKFSWENAVASPTVNNKTVVAGLDDSTPGQLYFYIGNKTNTGSEVEKAGLTNGKLYGVAVNGLTAETSANVPPAGTPFTLADMGNVTNMTGAALNGASNTAGVTTFLRPEDGAWDPSNLNDFYFVTTNAITAPSRLWKLSFTDPANPELGGTITAVLDGTEGQKMLDNMTIDGYGHALLQEDVGGNVHIGKIWQYTIATDELMQVAQHDSTRFITGSANFLTLDEEASGIIDMEDILGPGMFLTADQAHHSMPGEIYEGGQLLTFYNPSTYRASQGAGPSTDQTPYLLPTIPGAQSWSILTAGETIGSYRMAGIPDGIGAFDNNDGTFTVLMNHEIPSGSGAIRAHGANGAFVSKWTINKEDLVVQSGSDLIRNVNLWNGTAYAPSAANSFGRFCSADLPEVSSFYNSATGLGTQDRIFMNGEETGNEGRAFGHISTGPNAGTTYELPALGKFSWENSVASPKASNKTVVAGLDDSTPGQVYFYVGTKTNTGTEVEKAGLTNGKLYGLAVTGLTAETSASVPPAGTPFTLADLGNVTNMTGAALNSASNTAGVTTFLRPEDGAWDPTNLNHFYFVTTNSITAPSRLWKCSFTDAANPELGGTITAVLDGSEGHKMLDNMTLDGYGHALLQEDVGSNVHIGKMWQYTIATDELKQIAHHDSTRFLPGAPNFLTQDEEASGIIDMEEILGPGMFLSTDQAHYSIPGEIYEGGQLLAFFNPDTYGSSLSVTGVEDNIEDITSVVLYPNPTGDIATISMMLKKEAEIVITVYDVQGKEVAAPIRKNLQSGAQTVTLNTSTLTSGIYIVQISNGTDVTKIRTIVLH